MDVGAMLPLLLCGALALWVVAKEGLGTEIASPPVVAAGLVLVHFVIPGVLVVTDVVDPGYRLNARYWAPASWYVLICLATFLAGVVIARRLLCWKPGRPAETQGVREGTAIPRAGWLVAYCVLLIAVGWIARLYVLQQGAYFQLARTQLIGELHAIIRLAELLPFYALAFLLLAQHKSGRMVTWKYGELPWGRVGLWIYWSLELCYWALAGRRLQVLVVVLWPVLVWSLLGRRPVKSYLTGGLLVGGLLFTVLFFYRDAMRPELSQGRIPNVIRQSARAARIPVDGQTVLQLAVGRLNMLESVAGTMRIQSVGRWPRRWGGDYVNVVLNMVPRPLWPDKPNFAYGNEFGKAIGLISPGNNDTSVSVTYLGEGYLNFGWLGALVFLAVGAGLWKLWVLAIGGASAIAKMVYLVAFPSWAYVGGTAALYFAGFVKAAALTVGGYWVWRELGKAMTHRDGRA